MSKEYELISLLIDRTSTGETNWEPTATEDEFLTVVADEISVVIALVPSRGPNEEEPDYLLMVKDKNDRQVFSIRNHLEDVKYDDLQVLYERARRSALKIEETLNTLLEKLREGKP